MKPFRMETTSAFGTTIKATVLMIPLAVLILVGCGTAAHNVRVEDAQAFGADTRIVVGTVTNSTGETFDIDIEDMLSDAVMTKLDDEGLLGTPRTPDVLTMDLNIIEYEKGSAFKRWLWPGYGSTVLAVKGTLRDPAGNVDAIAEAKRTVDAGGGFTAGAWESVFEDIAADLITDLKAHVFGSKDQ